jgi:hypothetical protein
MAVPFSAHGRIFLSDYVRLFAFGRVRQNKVATGWNQRTGAALEQGASWRKGSAIPHIRRQSRRTKPENFTGNIFGSGKHSREYETDGNNGTLGNIADNQKVFRLFCILALINPLPYFSCIWRHYSRKRVQSMPYFLTL